MKKVLVAVVLLVGQFALADMCVRISSISGFSVLSDNTLRLDAAGNEHYDMTTFSCPQLSWADSIAFATHPFNSDTVCSGDSVVLLDISGQREIDRCTIDRIEAVR